MVATFAVYAYDLVREVPVTSTPNTFLEQASTIVGSSLFCEGGGASVVGAAFFYFLFGGALMAKTRFSDCLGGLDPPMASTKCPHFPFAFDD